MRLEVSSDQNLRSMPAPTSGSVNLFSRHAAYQNSAALKPMMGIPRIGSSRSDTCMRLIFVPALHDRVQSVPRRRQQLDDRLIFRPIRKMRDVQREVAREADGRHDLETEVLEHAGGILISALVEG